MRKIITAILLMMVLILPSLIIIPMVSNNVSAYSGYFLTQPVNFSPDGAQTNYPLKLTVYSGTGTNTAGNLYCQVKCANWPYDIHFTNNANVTIGHWRESYDATSQIVWINCTSIASTGKTNFNMYYGDGSSDTSNGTRVFPLFDDFNSGTVSSAKWTPSGAITTTGTGGKLTAYGTSSWGYLKSAISFPLGYAMRTRANYLGASGAGGSSLGYGSAGSANSCDLIYYNTGGSLNKLRAWSASNANTDTVATISPASYQIYDVSRYSTKYTAQIAGGTLLTATSTQTNNQVFTLATIAGSSYGIEVDWILFHKVTANEPTFTAPSGEHGKWSPTFIANPATTGNTETLYSYTIATNESTTITIMSKPSWMNYYSANTTLSGVPTVGATNISIRALSTVGNLYAYKNYTLTIGVLVHWSPSFDSTPSINTYVGLLYSYRILLNESATITIMSKPTWLNWYSGNTTLSGKPITANDYSVAIRALSVGGGRYAYQNYSIHASVLINLTWAPTFTSTPNENGYVNMSYSFYLTCNETATIVSYDLPTWITLSGWQISGRPNTTGTYNCTVIVHSVAGQLDSYQRWTIKVLNATNGVMDTGFTNVQLLGLLLITLFTVIGVLRPAWSMLTGIIWILVALLVMIPMSVPFGLFSLAVGMMFMVAGLMYYYYQGSVKN